MCPSERPDHSRWRQRPPPRAAPAALANEQELQAYRNILASDPKNVRANVELANRLYDAGRYAEAIPYYQQAFTGDPTNVSVSTDLATALYYAGRPDEALAQFDKSLAIDPKHGQTLFNVGIVRRDGKHDPEGSHRGVGAAARVRPGLRRRGQGADDDRRAEDPRVVNAAQQEVSVEPVRRARRTDWRNGFRRRTRAARFSPRSRTSSGC